jgi:hypothetical protein
LVGNTNRSKKGIEFLILAARIRLNGKDLVPKPSFIMLMKFNKIFRYIRFMTKQINSSEFTIIINKTDIIVFMTKGINGRTPHI